MQNLNAIETEIVAPAVVALISGAAWLLGVRHHATAHVSLVSRHPGPVPRDARRDRASFESGRPEAATGERALGRPTPHYPTWCPLLALRQDQDRLTIRAELEGIAHGEVAVEIYDDAVVILADWVRDAASGSFCRRVILPSDADPDEAAATFENDVLIISAPLKTGTSPRNGQ